MIELYRAVVPFKKLINDNHDQHYKIHQGNLDFLTKQFNHLLNNIDDDYVGPDNFKIPDISYVKEYLNNDKNKNRYIKIRCEIWKPRNIRFDPQNYAKTFKAPIDLLVSNGFLTDDSWKFVDQISYCGGGPEVWEHRAFRYKNDGLPKSKDDMLNWWNLHNWDLNDPLIRIILED